jgi:quercetin dioxygenase-like cupin family protein
MPHEGQSWVNARTGQRMTILELRPEVLLVDTVNPPGAPAEPEHTHPNQESGAEVRSGTLAFFVDGQERRVGPGQSITIPAGVPHRFANPGAEDAHAVQWMRPALRSAAFFETYAVLAAAGELDGRGMPRPLQLAVMVPEFGDEIRVTSPPWPVLRALAAVLRPLARARGVRAVRAFDEVEA